MRPILWFILFIAFSTGMCGAFALRFLYFEAVPVVAQTTEPQVKILIAKRAIPCNVEITADFVVFQEVAVSEVPLGAMTSFAQVYRRQPAYPIPAGCPVCEELLLPQSETAAQTAFLPPGSQFVSLDVMHVRQGEKVFSSKEPLSSVLAANQGIDVRVVLPEAQGRLAAKKNAVLRNFASQDSRNSGDLILANVPVYQIQRQFVADHAGSVRDVLKLVLAKDEAAQLAAAARRGQLRILVHQGPQKTVPPPMEIENLVEVADSSTQVFSLPFEPLTINVPSISESLSPVPVETTSAAPKEAVRQIVSESKAEEFFDTIAPPAPVPDFFLEIPQPSEVSPIFDQSSDSFTDPVVPEVVIKEKIRNDSPVLTFGVPALRIISERPMEQKQMTELLPTNRSDESKLESVSLVYSEPVAEFPRTSSTLQFHSTNRKALENEVAQQIESASVVELTAMPQENSASPFAPIILQEKVQGYSPFERRIYTVSTNEEESLAEVPIPPRKLRNSETQEND